MKTREAGMLGKITGEALGAGSARWRRKNAGDLIRGLERKLLDSIRTRWRA
jgi:hypothetical protein